MTMVMFGSILLVIASSSCYHLTQKTLSSTASPFNLLAITYGLAVVICLTAARILPSETGLIETVRTHGIAITLLSLAVVGIETGFLMTYRTGWSVGVLPIFINAGVTLALIPVGFIFYREHLGAANIFGIILIVAGLFLLGRR
ncbi:hypothetical protein [Desulfovibrio inopinatus]|uniref:hypothetical protein n=1 Tax=Desulfovibrio inopinatus TaxID=102109 RepID=UPI00041FC79D|nr:hypothetical protein [Desulfovibrio inopinatus]